MNARWIAWRAGSAAVVFQHAWCWLIYVDAPMFKLHAACILSLFWTTVSVVALVVHVETKGKW